MRKEEKMSKREKKNGHKKLLTKLALATVIFDLLTKIIDLIKTIIS